MVCIQRIPDKKPGKGGVMDYDFIVFISPPPKVFEI